MNISIEMITAMIWIVTWIICGTISYGVNFAVLQREYPTSAEEFQTADQFFSMFVGSLGPIGLIATMMAVSVCGIKFHGFMVQIPKEPTMEDFLMPEKRRK